MRETRSYCKCQITYKNRKCVENATKHNTPEKMLATRGETSTSLKHLWARGGKVMKRLTEQSHHKPPANLGVMQLPLAPPIASLLA